MKVAIPLSKPLGWLGSRPRRLSRKQIAVLAAAGLLSVLAGYTGYERTTAGARTAPALQTSPVRMGSLVSTVSATGSVVAARQAKLGFGASGKLAELNVAVGDAVKAGQQMAKLDQQALQLKVAQNESSLRVNQAKLQDLKNGATADEIAAARSSVDQAKANLASVQAKLEQVKAGPSAADLAAAQSSHDSAKASLASAEAKLATLKAGPTASDLAAAQAGVDQARANLASAQAKLEVVKAGPTGSDVANAQSAVNSAKSKLTSTEDDLEKAKNDRLSETGYTSVSAAQQAYDAAKSTYEAKVDDLNKLMAGPTTADLQSAQATFDQARASLASAQSKLDQLKPTEADLQSAQASVDQARASLAGAQSKLDQLKPTDIDLQSAQASVDQAKAGLANAQIQLSLKVNPPKALDLITAEEQVKQSEIALQQSKMDLQQSALTAPFEGVVATITGNVGEQVSGAVITLVDTKSARIDATVDESDVSKLAVGQPVSVTFDALPDKRLQGKVIAVAPAGTTTQGVVSYLLSVGIDPQGQTLPTGMSSTLSIETDRKDNVLLVPNRAVRIQGRAKVVEVIAGEKTEMKTVQTGASNDQSTEITSGLEAGEEVVIPSTTIRSTMSGNGRGGPVMIR